MTFARGNILRKIPTGPNPVIWDYRALLAGKLRAAWDVRSGGEFAPGLWVSHRDAVSGIRVAAPAEAQRPLAVVDGSNFRGRRVIRIANSGNRSMSTSAMPNVVPVNSKPEVFIVARLPSAATQGGNLCGCADAGSAFTAGASIWSSAGSLRSIAGGQATLGFIDDTTVHLFNAFADDTQHRFLIDNGNSAEAVTALAATTPATTQAAIGAFATGFGTTIDAFVALWGICCPAMTTAERAQFYAICREDWGF